MQNKKENDNAVIEFAVELGADEDWGPTNG